MEKITMNTPVVEIDGDEMARILWQKIKEKLLLPFVELKTEYYDLSLLNRNATDDRVTAEAGQAAVRLGVAVKCATITPNKKRMEEYPQLKKLYPSPNATIRSIMGGTIFRTPITVDFVEPAVRSWQKPITIARHAFGDIYKATEFATQEPGECTLVFCGQSGEEKRLSVQKVTGPAVWLGQFNLDESIRSFAKACFRYAIDSRQDLWFSAKDTISKTYDGHFRAVFEEEFEACRTDFERLGLRYFYTLIDDAVARVMRSPGGFIWACKNYDGDVMSDMISSAFSSLAMMTSVLVTPDGKYEFEAAHGTVTRHYYRYLKGEKTSTNPVAMIFAWSGALKKRGELDALPALIAFGEALEQACRNTLNSGKMTGDLAAMARPGFSVTVLNSEEFLDAIAEELTGILN
ncbi:MAG: NADP-dependent isocitrate dehydrogenase [Oscillospiraceae bacterium]|nr:NADP-dependent isocitrate dehydrogenase [Oscillospiraceae bacterium]